jgi:hypothetical protein
MLTLLAPVVAGWLTGLTASMLRPQLALFVLLGALAYCAAIYWYESLAINDTNDQWIGVTYFVMAGAAGGAIGPTLVKDDKLIAAAVSAITAPPLAFVLTGFAMVGV